MPKLSSPSNDTRESDLRGTSWFDWVRFDYRTSSVTFYGSEPVLRDDNAAKTAAGTTDHTSPTLTAYRFPRIHRPTDRAHTSSTEDGRRQRHRATPRRHTSAGDATRWHCRGLLRVTRFVAKSSYRRDSETARRRRPASRYLASYYLASRRLASRYLGIAPPGIVPPGIALLLITLPGIVLPGITLPGIAIPSIVLPGITLPGIALPGIAPPGITGSREARPEVSAGVG